MHETRSGRKSIWGEALFCLTLVSIFFPVKIYPVVFLLASLLYLGDTPTLLRHPWVGFLALFTGYATLMLAVYPPKDIQVYVNFLKLPINLGYLYCSVGWLVRRSNSRLLTWVDVTLHAVFAITLLQLLVYHYVA